MTSIDCVICDLDLVYTDSRLWNKHLPTDPKSREQWDAYAEKHYLAKPNKFIVSKIVAISKYMPILFVTSREDRHDMRKKTIREIESFSGDMIKIGTFHKLYMRKDCDYDPSAVVKEGILLNDILPNHYNPVIAIDDDSSNIEMFKKHGIPVKLYDINKVSIQSETKNKVGFC